MTKEELIRHILETEWQMFSTVQNKGGKASCQDDSRTFSIMRMAQLNVWEEAVLASYLLDLLEAKDAGRNLMTEKYAFMMEKTYPEEYEALKSLLPEVTERKKNMAKGILEIYSIWEKEVAMCYPKIRKHGRHRSDEGSLDGSVSADDYLYCELQTYSERTLELLLQQIGEKTDRNLYMEELFNMVKAYGYHSLEEAEAAL